MSWHKVIIVGSSDSVLQANHGAQIDGYDRVIRFNRAPIRGYEQHIGTRTDERWVNPEVLFGEEHTGRTVLPFDEVKYERIVATKMISLSQFYGIWGKSNTFTFVKPNYWQSCLASHKIEAKKINPTMGFEAICYWSLHDVTITGFDLEDRLHHHYWRPEARNSTFHDYKWEKSIMRKLIEKKIIKVL